jgi:hypothetical protein
MSAPLAWRPDLGSPRLGVLGLVLSGCGGIDVAGTSLAWLFMRERLLLGAGGGPSEGGTYTYTCDDGVAIQDIAPIVGGDDERREAVAERFGGLVFCAVFGCVSLRDSRSKLAPFRRFDVRAEPPFGSLRNVNVNDGACLGLSAYDGAVLERSSRCSTADLRAEESQIGGAEMREFVAPPKVKLYI